MPNVGHTQGTTHIAPSSIAYHTALVLMLLTYALVLVVSTQCPAGWTGAPSTSKCMKLTAPSTHEGCTARCGADASLACIQTAGDSELAAMLQPMNFKVFVWTGEYQWPFEPELKIQLRGEPGSGKPYNAQPGWGQCSNGQTTNLTWSMLAPLQPNNYNGAEDCMGRALVGYADNVCTESLPCLCEWQPDGSSRTTSAYKNIHGPALTKRAIEATELVYTTILSSFVK